MTDTFNENKSCFDCTERRGNYCFAAERTLTLENVDGVVLRFADANPCMDYQKRDAYAEIDD